MKTWLARQIMGATGPKENSAEAIVQSAWLDMAGAKDRKGWETGRELLLGQAAKSGFTEIVAAEARYRRAMDGAGERPEIAIKALSTAIYLLPHRPSVSSPAGRLLDTWARLDEAFRTQADSEADSDLTALLIATFRNACVESGAADAVRALIAFAAALSAGAEESTFDRLLDPLAYHVFRHAYRREPPPSVFSYGPP